MQGGEPGPRALPEGGPTRHTLCSRPVSIFVFASSVCGSPMLMMEDLDRASLTIPSVICVPLRPQDPKARRVVRKTVGRPLAVP